MSVDTLPALERELYSVAEAGRLLDIPSSTLRWWLDGRDDHPAVIRTDRTGSSYVTWGEFVEAGLLRQYRKKRVLLGTLRRFVATVRERTGIPYPLAHHRPLIGEGRRLLLEAQEESGLKDRIVFATDDGQLLLSADVATFLEKIDWAPDGYALRLHPAGKSSPVVIDPDTAFGSPSVHGIRTEVLAELMGAGEDLDTIAESYDLAPAVVKAALAYEWRSAA